MKDEAMWDEIARLRDAFLRAVPAALDDRRFGEMMGSPWSVLQYVIEHFSEQEKFILNPTINLDLYMIEGVEREWLEAFEVSVGKHIAFVQEAGQRLGVPLSQLAIHDNSKYSLEEFPHYARSFHGDRGDPAGFAVAWLHHQNLNPHHWEYWITRSDHSKGKSGAVNSCLPMPENYVREMVADWMGASMAYTGKWEIDEWCTNNCPNMKMHPDTWRILGEVLRELGYKGAVYDPLANTFNVRPSDWIPPKPRAINYV